MRPRRREGRGRASFPPREIITRKGGDTVFYRHVSVMRVTPRSAFNACRGEAARGLAEVEASPLAPLSSPRHFPLRSGIEGIREVLILLTVTGFLFLRASPGLSSIAGPPRGGRELGVVRLKIDSAVMVLRRNSRDNDKQIRGVLKYTDRVCYRFRVTYRCKRVNWIFRPELARAPLSYLSDLLIFFSHQRI